MLIARNMTRRYLIFAPRSVRWMPVLTALTAQLLMAPPIWAGGGTPAVTARDKSTLPVEFVGNSNGAITLDWTSLRRGESRITITNTSGDDHKLNIDLAAAPAKSPISQTEVKVDPTNLTLLKHGIAVLKLVADPATEAAVESDYDAMLVVSDAENKDAPAVVRLHAAATPLQTGVVKLSQLTMQPLRSPWTVSIDAPLINTVMPAVVPPVGSVVGFVRSDNGAYLAVHLLGIDPAKPQGTSSAADGIPRPPLVAHLQIEPMRHGHFEGNIYLNSADPRAALSIAIDGQDHVAFALIVIFAGIGLAALSKVYLTTYRILWLLRRQIQQLPSFLATAARDFQKKAPGSKFDPTRDLGRQREALALALDSFNSWERMIADNRAFFDDRLKELKAIQSQAYDWVNLGDTLSTLKGVTHSIREALGEKDGDLLATGAVPLCVNDADSFYDGIPVAGTDLAKQQQSAQSQIDLLRCWKNIWDYWEKAQVLNAKCKDPELGPELVGALEQIRVDLFAVQTADLLPPIKARIYGVLERLSAAPSNAAQVSDSATGSGAYVPIEPELIISAAKTPARSSEGESRRFRMLVRYGDATSFTFGVSLAILAALDTYYIGKPFGSLHDYIALFLAAAGTKAGVDLVASLVDKFAGVATARSI